MRRHARLQLCNFFRLSQINWKLSEKTAGPGQSRVGGVGSGLVPPQDPLNGRGCEFRISASE